MQSLAYKERWKIIPEFPNYEISNLGRIYNTKEDLLMRASNTGHGNVKITLKAEDGQRYTRSVAQIVAEAFVEPPKRICDHVVVLDGNLANVAADNLVWRPAWYAWKYIRQLKTDQPNHYVNLTVMNLTQAIEYDSVVEAGMVEGLLFDDIWRSTYTGAEIFPGDQCFEITGKSMGSHLKHGIG